jgi:hypothetical protein
MGTKQIRKSKQPKQKTPTVLLELPLQVEAGQAKRLHAHLEAVRQFYNALLSEGQKRLGRMQAAPARQAARALAGTQPLERQAAFFALRKAYGFSGSAFQDVKNPGIDAGACSTPMRGEVGPRLDQA